MVRGGSRMDSMGGGGGGGGGHKRGGNHHVPPITYQETVPIINFKNEVPFLTHFVAVHASKPPYYNNTVLM